MDAPADPSLMTPGDEVSIPTLTVQELDADPHGVFRRYRPIVPFIAHESGCYMVLRAADVERLIKDPRLSQGGTEFPEACGIVDGPLHDALAHMMLNADGDTHRRRRSPLTRAFAARLIAELRPHIRAVADDLIDSWYASGQVDLVAQYASLIPARTVADLLGLPHEEVPYFTDLGYKASKFLSLSFTAEDMPVMQAAMGELCDYVARLIESRRQSPRQDFVSNIVAEADQRGDLVPLELIHQIVTIIIGGTDTTRVAMAIQVSLLLQHPDQWDALCRDPALVPDAVAEALRFEPSGAPVARKALEDIELDGRVIPANAFVILSTISAMRDEEAYRHPDVFDIFRSDRPRIHPVFGGGAHRCIGEALAKAELEEGLAELTARLPDLRLANTPPVVEGHMGIRRIGEMDVTWPIV